MAKKANIPDVMRTTPRGTHVDTVIYVTWEKKPPKEHITEPMTECESCGEPTNGYSKLCRWCRAEDTGKSTARLRKDRKRTRRQAHVVLQEAAQMPDLSAVEFTISGGALQMEVVE